jgi:Rieske Fe-S protein
MKRRLPTVSCTRREVVQGVGLATVTALLGCGGGGDGDVPVDAVDGTGTAMCGANLCLDLAHPANAMLAAVDGARTVNITGDKLIIVRTSATTFAVLSRVCTHNGCSVGYTASLMQLSCPCHGSRFALDGSVTREPADRALRVYASTYDEATQTLTITV